MEEIWHVLFNFDDEVKVVEFAINKLGLVDKLSDKFRILWKKLPDGYAQLSLNALIKINEYLLLGFRYDEAVFYANMPKVLGNDFFQLHKVKIQEGVKYIYDNQNFSNSLLKIVNNLIGRFLALDESQQFGFNSNYQLDEDDKNDIKKSILDFWGRKTWDGFDTVLQGEITEKVSMLYLKYLQLPFGSKKNNFHKILRLDEAVIQFLKDNFEHITEKDLAKLYHPSDNDIYQPSLPTDDGKKYLQSPKTGSFKNPMAMRTLYELKRLINYLIESGEIDEDDRIVIELARDLNDANMRKAIEKWQNDNEKKNEEYKKEIERHGYDPNDKDLVHKVRLWYEQGQLSVYTGAMINIADVFDGMKFQIEHTIPASISFDDSLANKTLCEVAFNAKKSNKIPFELDNYEEILSRVEPWEEKVEHFKKQIEFWKKQSKMAQTKDRKDKCIQEKHYNRFELDYWKNKLSRFKMKEVKGGFRNANLVDTQIISKYAFHYLKSVFKRVDVQKGEVTAIFRKIYEIKEEKDRTKHTHHTVDASVLTLIPKVSEREKILKEYFETLENGLKFHAKPWPLFHQNQILALEENTLIQNTTRDKAIVQTVKYVRKRGKIVYLTNVDGSFILDNNGKKIPKIAKGDTIRGQLHNESMLGAIILPKLDEYGLPLRTSDGQFDYEKDAKSEFVIRKALTFGDLGFTKREQLLAIVDPIVRKKILDHVDKYGMNKETFKHPIWMNEEKRIKINKVRVKTSVTDPIHVRKHIFESAKAHKRYYYAETAKGANIICALYQYEVKGKTEREIEIINLMDAAGLVSKGLLNEKGEISISKSNKSGEIIYPDAILRPGIKVVFYERNIEELKDLDDNTISKRLYRVLKFSHDYPITFEHHLDAQSSGELSEKAKKIGDRSYFTGYSKIDLYNSKPRLLLSKSNFNFAIEGKHFEMQPDGSIKWKI